MIYFIKGQIYKVLKDSVVIENSAGIGYEVICNNKTLSKFTENETVRLITYTHIIQDDIKLFGFSDERELNLFKMLITVNGVGCRSALGILEVNPNEFINAIINDDAKALTKIKGVGLKTAQRIIIELKNTIKNIVSEDSTDDCCENVQDAKYALLALGYTVKAVELAVENIDKSKTVDEIVKDALKALNK